MRVEFERSLNHNYMIIKNMGEFCEDYQIHMLMEQRIPHVLRMELRFMNGKPELYYDISSKQKLSEWLKIKKITHDILRGLIKSLKNAFEAGIDYLLEGNHFILEAEYIFIDVERYELSLCYYPLYDKEATQSGQEFLQYILEMLDYNDKQAVEEAYEIFRLCMRDGFSIELLRKFVKEEDNTREDMQRGDLDTEAEWVQVVPPLVMDEEVEEEREEFGFIPINVEGRRKAVVMLLAAEVLISLIIFLLFRKEIVAWIVWGGITLLIAGVILIFTCFYERLMQFTRIVSTKKWIPYDDNMYMEPQYEEEEEQESDKAVNIDVPDYIKAQETVLLGYNKMLGGCRRLCYIGEGVQEDIVITKNPFTVGKSDRDTDYRLQYPFVSRIHFRIDERAGDYFITDTNSKNGIMLNKEYLKANETAKLLQGDRIEIGNLVFLFQ